MKRLMLIAFTAIAMPLFLDASGKAILSIESLALQASTDVDVPAGQYCGVDSNGAQVNQRWVYRQNEGAEKVQQRKEAQSDSGASDILVQATGKHCVTPSGTCELPSAMPLGSSCCCSFACGYVAP